MAYSAAIDGKPSNGFIGETGAAKVRIIIGNAIPRQWRAVAQNNA
jgi:hypothetical protein